MIAPRVFKALMHLKKHGHSKLAEKIWTAITTGKTANFTGPERRAYLTVRGELEGTKAFTNPLLKFKGGFQLRKELGFQPIRIDEYKSLQAAMGMQDIIKLTERLNMVNKKVE